MSESFLLKVSSQRRFEVPREAPCSHSRSSVYQHHEGAASKIRSVRYVTHETSQQASSRKFQLGQAC